MSDVYNFKARPMSMWQARKLWQELPTEFKNQVELLQEWELTPYLKGLAPGDEKPECLDGIVDFLQYWAQAMANYKDEVQKVQSGLAKCNSKNVNPKPGKVAARRDGATVAKAVQAGVSVDPSCFDGGTPGESGEPGATQKETADS